MCSHIARDEQPWLTISRELVRNAIARGRKLRLTREWQEWHPPEGDGMGLQVSKVTTDKELRELTILSSQQRLYGRQAAAHRWAAFSGTSEPVPPLGWLACSRLGRLARPPLGGWLALRWVGWLALRACAQPVSRANQSHLSARCPKPQSTPRSNILTCFSLREKHNCQTDMRQKLNQPPWPGEQVILLFFSFLQSASIFWRPLQCSLTYISKTMLSVL